MYPNLFIIGAAKSGTSSLHYYLSLHPEIHMSRDKEPHFFSRSTRYTDAQYQALFESDLPIRGESSVTYSFWPHPSGVPELIHRVAPDARFIYVVRDPVERALAHYNHRIALGTETRSLEDVIERPDDARERYIAASRYAEQLDQYVRVFSAERIHVIDHHDLLGDRSAVLRDAFAFLGVEETFHSGRFDVTVNRGADTRRFSPLGEWARHTPVYKRATGWIRPDVRLRIVKPFRDLLSSETPKATLTDAQHAVLAERFADDAARLRAFTGKKFSTWSV